MLRTLRNTYRAVDAELQRSSRFKRILNRMGGQHKTSERLKEPG